MSQSIWLTPPIWKVQILSRIKYIYFYLSQDWSNMSRSAAQTAAPPSAGQLFTDNSITRVETAAQTARPSSAGQLCAPSFNTASWSMNDQLLRHLHNHHMVAGVQIITTGIPSAGQLVSFFSSVTTGLMVMNSWHNKTELLIAAPSILLYFFSMSTARWSLNVLTNITVQFYWRSRTSTVDIVVKLCPIL